MPRHRSIDVDDPLEHAERPLSAFEVAQLFGVRKETIVRWVQEGKLACTRNPRNNYREFDPDYIRHMLTVLKPGHAAFRYRHR